MFGSVRFFGTLFLLLKSLWVSRLLRPGRWRVGEVADSEITP